MLVMLITMMTTMSMMMLSVNLPKFLEFEVGIVGDEDHHDLYDDVPSGATDLKFVKYFTRPDFWAKKFTRKKMRKLRLFC